MSSLALEDISSMLVKAGSAIILVLGIADVLKGIIVVAAISVLGSIAGSILSSLTPLLGFTGWLLPLLGFFVGGLNIIAGAIAAAIGYFLLKLPTPLPAEQRNKWLLLTAIFAAVALIFLSHWYLLAFALVLLGFLLSPARPPPSSSPTPLP